ncbi:MAG: shikimate dehydrogenase [Proteobacteria bacterium]|nr:shikimate dehydrogenase [Pseudomonadota bacterium]
MTSEPYRLGVAGNPIAHSLSPTIHAAFASACGDAVDYQRYLFPRGQFASRAQDFFQQGGTGLNVTVPFKQDAHTFADELDPLAAAAGAVNTLALREQRIVGFNTDGVGMVRDIEVRHGVTLRSLSVLILGAGGACRGIVQPLLNAGVEKIFIANRTLKNAQTLIQHFDADVSTRLEALTWSQLDTAPPRVDAILNSTSIGLLDNASELLQMLPTNLLAHRFCYDLSYGPSAHFAAWAAQCGAAMSADGLGMLVEQAAESYRIWLGRQPATEAVYQTLRSQLSS